MVVSRHGRNLRLSVDAAWHGNSIAARVMLGEGGGRAHPAASTSTYDAWDNGARRSPFRGRLFPARPFPRPVTQAARRVTVTSPISRPASR
jgi:hypothetical protein